MHTKEKIQAKFVFVIFFLQIGSYNFFHEPQL